MNRIATIVAGLSLAFIGTATTFTISAPVNHFSGGFAAGDVNQDGDVDIADLVAMRAALGLCKSDVDSDYDTDVMDLLWVIDGWNTVCP